MTDIPLSAAARPAASSSGVPWWAIGVVGLLDIGAGILAIVYPDITLLVIALILGIYLLVAGAIALGGSLFSGGDTVLRVLQAVVGLFAVMAGLAVLRRPGDSLLALVVIVGILFVIQGIVAVARGIAEAEGRGLQLALGIFDVALGGVILAWPHIGLATFAVLVALSLILHGLGHLVLAVAARQV